MRSKLLGLGLAVSVVTPLAVLVGPSATSEPRAGVAPRQAESVTCKKTFQSGSGPTFFRWCFSTDGNVQQIQTPSGFHHVNIDEGYVLCANGAAVPSYDAGGVETEWGPSSFPTAMSVSRKTSDNRFQLVQTFSQDAASGVITVKMALTNLTGGSIGNVQLARYFHPNMDNDAGDDIGDHSQASVNIRDLHGLLLTATSFATNHTAVIESFTDWNPVSANHTAQGCGSIPLGVPVAGDLVGRVTYLLGSIAAHASKSVTFRYERY
jgi:hypothetical protein